VPGETTRARARGHRFAVWGLWAACSAGLFAHVLAYGSPIPHEDDWEMVPVLSHHTPPTLGWLWEPQNEHRFPLTKVILYGWVRLSGGDYRGGMLLSVAILSFTALGLARTAGRLRGAPRFTDAFFPLAMLHGGHQQNLLQQIQLFTVGAGVLGCLALLLVAGGRWAKSAGAAAMLGLTLGLLPLHGLMGLVLATVPTMWALWVSLRPAPPASAGGRTARRVLACFALATVVVAGLYFRELGVTVGRATGASPGASLRTLSELLGASLGPAGARTWPWSALAVSVLLLGTVWWLVRAVLRPSPDRDRAAGLLACVASATGLVVVVTLGRSVFGPGIGFQPRYMILVFPLLAAAYYTWGLYAPAVAGRFVQTALFAVAAGCLWFNWADGREYARIRRQASDAFMAELQAGQETRRLVAKYWTAIYPARAPLLARMRMLKRAGHGPYQPAARTRVVAGGSTNPWTAADPSPPPGCHFERPLSTAPLRLHGMTWTDGVGHGKGNDPYVVFSLPPQTRFCGVRLEYSLQTGDQMDGGLQFFWARTNVEAFTPTERNWRTWVRSGPELRTLFVPVAPPADVLRIDPDIGPVDFKLVRLVLLQGEPAATGPPPTAPP
jgi:hypothetical protein